MFFKEQINSKNLRITLETLINIRWIAVIGQFFTVSFVYYGLKFKFPYIETLILISISVLINIFLEFNKTKFLTISNFYATISIFYDLVQLILLLFIIKTDYGVSIFDAIIITCLSLYLSILFYSTGLRL